MWFVYILKCGDNSLYTGITNDVKKRFELHRNGRGARYTRSRRARKIVYRESCSSRSRALKREAEIKKWPRAKKLALINAGKKGKKESLKSRGSSRIFI